MVRVIGTFAAVVVLASGSLAAQSLVDVAKAEESRRKTVAKPGKVYTNTDLKSDGTTPAPTASTPAAPATDSAAGAAPATDPAASAKAPAAAPATPPRDQAYWKARMTEARDAVERSKMFLEALQSRVNALMTQFVNRDDPYQRSSLEQERLKNLAEIERVKKDIETQTKAIAAVEEEARKAGVPPGWLR